MSKSALTKTLVGLTGLFLLLACFLVVPVSISLGQNGKPTDGTKCLTLQPGQHYMVYSDKPITLPEGVRFSSCLPGTALRHDGTHKDKPVHCGGAIKMVLRDNGCIEYQCVVCKRKWIRDAEGKLVKGSDGD